MVGHLQNDRLPYPRRINTWHVFTLRSLAFTCTSMTSHDGCEMIFEPNRMPLQIGGLARTLQHCARSMQRVALSTGVKRQRMSQMHAVNCQTISIVIGMWLFGGATFRQENLEQNGEAMIRLPVSYFFLAKSLAGTRESQITSHKSLRSVSSARPLFPSVAFRAARAGRLCATGEFCCLRWRGL